MLKFKKDFNVKIISLVIAVLFVFNSTVYGIDISNRSHLRAPLMEAYERMLKAMEQKYKGLVISKIQELQAKGNKSDTIIRKIKKEFPESEYHLQEWIRVGDDNNFYVHAGDNYFEIVNGKVKRINKKIFELGRRILVKVIRGPDSKKELDAEIKETASGLAKELGRLPNIREVAEATPSLKTSRDPVALLYKHFQSHNINPSDYGIGRFSGKASMAIKKNFLFAGTRIFLPRQLSNMVQLSAEKTPISEETKIDIVDIKHPDNRLTLEHIKEKGVLRLTYTRPSGKKITADISGIKGKTSATLTLNPVFSDFYDTVFSIPLEPGEARLKAVAQHLRSRNAIYYTQEERYINFHGHLDLPSFYKTHPGRIKIYRDRESWVRFLVFEDMADPDNIVGYEWREGRIIPFVKGPALKPGSKIGTMPLYYLNKSGVFREFDQKLDKSIETRVATPDSTRLSEISMGTGRFAFRVEDTVRIISFEGSRSKKDTSRDDRERYPIRIVRSDGAEIKIRYRNPEVQGEFVVEGLNWEDGSPVALKGPAGYGDKRGYFNLSTIIEMVRQGLLPGIKVSDWLLETFSFSEGQANPNLRNRIRSYRVEEPDTGERFIVEDILVDPKTFKPWPVSGESGENEIDERVLAREHRRHEADQLVTEGEAARQQGQYDAARNAWSSAVSIYEEISEVTLAQSAQRMLRALEKEVKGNLRGSPLHVFSFLSDGKSYTRRNIAGALKRSDLTIQLDLAFLVKAGVIERVGIATYRLKPELKGDQVLIDDIQNTLDAKFGRRMITKNLKNRARREDIIENIKQQLAAYNDKELQQIYDGLSVGQLSSEDVSIYKLALSLRNGNRLGRRIVNHILEKLEKSDKDIRRKVVDLALREIFSQLRALISKKKPKKPFFTTWVICNQNRERSPIVAAVIREHIPRDLLEYFEIESYGLYSAGNDRVSIKGHISLEIPDSIPTADLILTMTEGQMETVQDKFLSDHDGRQRVRMAVQGKNLFTDGVSREAYDRFRNRVTEDAYQILSLILSEYILKIQNIQSIDDNRRTKRKTRTQI